MIRIDPLFRIDAHILIKVKIRLVSVYSAHGKLKVIAGGFAKQFELPATGAGCDHPVAGDFPQGRYLKALFARVD